MFGNEAIYGHTANRPTAWVGIDPYCEIEEIPEVYYEHKLYEVPLGGVGDPVAPGNVSVYATNLPTSDLQQGQYIYTDDQGVNPFVGDDSTYHYTNVAAYDEIGGDYCTVNSLGKITDVTS